MIDIDFLNIGNAKTSAKIFNENANEAPIFTSERETKREHADKGYAYESCIMRISK